MKLPSGKLSKTVNGGENSLKDLMNEAEGTKLTGYFEIHLENEGGATKGQIVLKEGVPVLCDYEKGGKETPGKDSVMNILRDSMDENAKLEVHTAIDADMMITFFKNASITPDDMDVEKLLADLEEEKRKQQEELERQRQEEARKEELKQELEGWRGQGYIVARLENVFDKPVGDIEELFNQYRNDLETLKAHEHKLEELVPKSKGFETYVQAIESQLNNPDSVPQIEEQLGALQKGIDEQEMRREELRKRVNAWKKEGYVVDALEQAIEEDLNAAWDKFTQYMDDIQKLKEADEKLVNMNTKGFEDESFEIEALLGNPEQLAEIQQRIQALEDLIASENQKKEEIKGRVEGWKGEGFEVGVLMEVFIKRLAEVEKEVAEYEQLINTLKTFRSEIEGIMTLEYEDNKNELMSKTNDPSNADDIRSGIEELKSKVAEADQKRTELNAKVQQYQGEGYVIGDLETAGQKILWDFEKDVGAFDEKIGKLKELEERLNGMDTRWMDEVVGVIRGKFKDPGLIDEITEDLNNMDTEITAREEKRNAIKAEMETWKEEGFVIATLEAIIDEAIEPIVTVHEQLTASINGLKEIESELGSMDVKWFETEAEELKGQLRDPNEVEAVKEKMNGLKEKISQDRNRRNELTEKYDAWIEEGYEFSGEKDALFDKNLYDLEEAFKQFETNIQVLISTKEKLEAIDSGDLKWFGEQVDAIKGDLGKIDIATEVEGRFKELVTEVMRQKEVRDGFKANLMKWKEEGFVCDELDEKIDAVLEEAEAAHNSLSEKIQKLVEAGQKLAGLNTKWFQGDADVIEGKLKDPEQLEAIFSELEKLEENINAEEARRGELKAKLEEWRGKGFNVEKLDTVMEEELKIIETEFESFEKDLKTLLELQAKLGGGAPAAAAPAAAPAAEGEPAPEPAGDAYEFTELDLNTNLTFKTFVVGASNRFTHAAAQAVADKPADSYNPLFIYGGSGLGKTHLLNAVGNYIKQNHSNMTVVYVTVEKFTNDLIEAVRLDKLNEFRSTYRKADVLLIDDIQFLGGKESTQEEFFHTFNTLYSARKQIAITSDRPPKDIPTLEDRLRSRFEGGLITDIQPPSLETKIIILRREAKKQNLDVPDEVMHLLASKIKTNIRELEGALTKIAAYSDLQKKKIDTELANEVLNDILEEKKAGGGEGGEGGDSEPTAKSKELMKRLSSLKASLKDKEEEAEGGEAPAEGGEAPAEDGAKAKCLNCGKMVPANTDKCPECGTQFAGDMFECPKCKQMVPTNATECPNCNVKFKKE